MKTIRIFSLLCIILFFASIKANAQVTHFREVTSVQISGYLDCIGVSLSGEEVDEWFWSFDPITGYNVQVKINADLVGTDGKNYSYHLIWNERENDNQKASFGRWTATEQLRCEGKVVGVVKFTFHWTLPASAENSDGSAYFDRTDIKCK